LCLTKSRPRVYLEKNRDIRTYFGRRGIELTVAKRYILVRYYVKSDCAIISINRRLLYGRVYIVITISIGERLKQNSKTVVTYAIALSIPIRFTEIFIETKYYENCMCTVYIYITCYLFVIYITYIFIFFFVHEFLI